MGIDGVQVVLFRRVDGGRGWEALAADVADAIGRGQTKVQALADLQMQLVVRRGGGDAIPGAE